MKKNLSHKIVLGTEVFSGSWGVKFSSEQIKKILIFGYKKGIKELDTAPIYGIRKHSVEKTLGNIIKKENLKYKISTKFTINNLLLIDKKKLLKDLDSQLKLSLKSLKRDYIDNYFFHSGTDDEFFNDYIWEFLSEKKKNGLIKNLCLSLKHELVKKKSLNQLYLCHKYKINKISTVCNLYTRDSLKKVIPFCKKNNITIYGRMPLAKGLLTGKYNNVSKFNKTDPRGNNLKQTNEIINFSKKIKNLSAKNSVLWSSKHCEKIILGFKNIDQIKNILE
ncbi:aldo/keto reductase [Candidatus Pelagibacter sp.]|nr:aldo/keto reductase [Candidatus Pelagibacter sp.]